MKTKNAFTYKESSEALILNIVSDVPKTTHKIQEEAKMYFSKIHFNTVKRMLTKLWKKGMIRKIEMGRYELWLK